MNKLKFPSRASIFYFIIFLGLLAFVFRSLIAGISTHLPDWYDYPLVVWIMNSNVDKFTSLKFSGLFNTNMLYPHPNSLLLTETFFTQSFLAIPFKILSPNPILVFNIVFLFTFVLNYLAAYLFWLLIFKKHPVAFLGSLITVFSPIIHAELAHFQIQSYWPTFLCLYFIIKAESSNRWKNLIAGGVFLAIQFMASVYLAFFLLAALGLYFGAKVILDKKLVFSLKSLAIVLTTFILLSGPLIAGYLKVGRQYQVQRDYGEFVFYSAHLSDYVFSRGYKSFIHNLGFINRWNSFNHHNIGGLALFPGFILTIFGSLAIFNIKKKKEGVTFGIVLERDSLFFFFLVAVGLLFSFGPRINFNGFYTEIPLPYHFLLKYIPIFEVIRAPFRWFVLFYFGLIFFALKFLSGRSLKFLSVSLLAILIILEYLPSNIQSHPETYLQPKDEVLKNICSQESKVLLEIPVTHFDAGEDILQGLNYITKTILASSYHKCYLVNGYSSYDLPSIANLKNSLYETSLLAKESEFTSTLEASQAEILVVNEQYLKPEVKDDFLAMIERLVKSKYLIPESENVFQIRIPLQ